MWGLLQVSALFSEATIRMLSEASGFGAASAAAASASNSPPCSFQVVPVTASSASLVRALSKTGAPVAYSSSQSLTASQAIPDELLATADASLPTGHSVFGGGRPGGDTGLVLLRVHARSAVSRSRDASALLAAHPDAAIGCRVKISRWARPLGPLGPSGPRVDEDVPLALEVVDGTVVGRVGAQHVVRLSSQARAQADTLACLDSVLVNLVDQPPSDSGRVGRQIIELDPIAVDLPDAAAVLAPVSKYFAECEVCYDLKVCAI